MFRAVDRTESLLTSTDLRRKGRPLGNNNNWRASRPLSLGGRGTTPYGRQGLLQDLDLVGQPGKLPVLGLGVVVGHGQHPLSGGVPLLLRLELGLEAITLVGGLAKPLVQAVVLLRCTDGILRQAGQPRRLDEGEQPGRQPEHPLPVGVLQGPQDYPAPCRLGADLRLSHGCGKGKGG